MNRFDYTTDQRNTLNAIFALLIQRRELDFLDVGEILAEAAQVGAAFSPFAYATDQILLALYARRHSPEGRKSHSLAVAIVDAHHAVERVERELAAAWDDNCTARIIWAERDLKEARQALDGARSPAGVS